MAKLYFSERLPSEDAGYEAYAKFSTWVTGGYMKDFLKESNPDLGRPVSGPPDLVVDGPEGYYFMGFQPCHNEDYWTVLDLIQAWFELGHGAQHVFSYSMHLRFIAVACSEWDNDGRNPDDACADLNIKRDWDSGDTALHQLHDVELRRAMLPLCNADGFGATKHPVFDEGWFLEWKMKAPHFKGQSYI